MIKTVTVSGITAVDFDPDNKDRYFYLSDKFVWIKNNSADTIYVSEDENCIPGADGTASVSAGECRRIKLSVSNVLYFSGDGEIEADTSGTPVCPFKSSGKGGGSGGDYTALTNKPKINGFTLTGDKSFSDLGLEWVAPDVVADEFDDSENYSAGDYVVYGGRLYKFSADHTGAWDDADADIVTVMGEISSGGSAELTVVNEPTAEEIAASAAGIWG